MLHNEFFTDKLDSFDYGYVENENDTEWEDGESLAEYKARCSVYFA